MESLKVLKCLESFMLKTNQLRFWLFRCYHGVPKNNLVCLEQNCEIIYILDIQEKLRLYRIFLFEWKPIGIRILLLTQHIFHSLTPPLGSFSQSGWQHCLAFCMGWKPYKETEHSPISEGFLTFFYNIDILWCPSVHKFTAK